MLGIEDQPPIDLVHDVGPSYKEVSVSTAFYAFSYNLLVKLVMFSTTDSCRWDSIPVASDTVFACLAKFSFFYVRLMQFVVDTCRLQKAVT